MGADVARLRGVADVAAVLLDHHAVVYVRHVTNDSSGHRPGKLIGEFEQVYYWFRRWSIDGTWERLRTPNCGSGYGVGWAETRSLALE